MLGPWLSEPPSNTKYATKLSRQKELLGRLIDNSGMIFIIKTFRRDYELAAFLLERI